MTPHARINQPWHALRVLLRSAADRQRRAPAGRASAPLIAALSRRLYAGAADFPRRPSGRRRLAAGERTGIRHGVQPAPSGPASAARPPDALPRRRPSSQRLPAPSCPGRAAAAPPPVHLLDLFLQRSGDGTALYPSWRLHGVSCSAEGKQKSMRLLTPSKTDGEKARAAK